MMITRTLRLALAGCLAVSLTGCSALSGLNPFKTKETILAGERTPVLPQAESEAAGGAPSIGGGSGLSDWPQPGGNAANAPGNVALSGGSGAAAWRTRVIAGGGRSTVRASAPPVVSGGTIFVYDASGAVTAVTSGGAKGWSVSLAPEKNKKRVTGGGVASGGSAVYAATGFGELVALDAASGARAWSFALGAPAYSAPTVAGGKVYVVDANNILHAVNAGDGTEAWQYSGIPETAGVLSAASPAVSGDTVVVPYSSGEVIAFDASSGKPKWSDSVIRSTRNLAVSGLTDVAASPIVDDGVVYATGVSGRTIAVRLADGERVWEQPIGSATTPAVSGNAVFLVDLQDNLVALDRANGKVFWKSALPVVRKKRFFSVWAGPTLAGGTLWSVSNDRRLVGADPATGNIVVDQKLPSPAYVKPIAAGGQLLLLSADGSLSAFR